MSSADPAERPEQPASVEFQSNSSRARALGYGYVVWETSAAAGHYVEVRTIDAQRDRVPVHKNVQLLV